MQRSINSPVKEIEINDEFKRSLEIMENSPKNIFITGRAGTGKSTLLDYFRNNTEKEIAVLAPTGVGAVNVKGETIHSFFGFKPNVTLSNIKKKYKKESSKNIYKKLDAIVIDEISMVRADLLDCVDKFLRLNANTSEKPFGGIQMIFIGDLYQLPPVVTGEEREIFKSHYETPYFFSAKSFDNLQMDFIELEKIYRQKDESFIRLLNGIRNNSINDDDIKELNQRFDPSFEPQSDDFYVYLTTTNAMAEAINAKRLAELKGEVNGFYGEIEGSFGREYLPTAVELKLKVGAQVMLLNNDQYGRWVNGTIGEIRSIEANHDGDGFITVELSDGEIVEVTPFTWEIFKFYVDGGELASDVVGSFTQFPIKLAWAVTIHKSQGKTFDKVIIDMGRGAFTHGQTYVALSRCTTLEGIVLKKPIKKGHVLMDWRVVRFLTKYQYQKSEEKCSLDEKISIIERAIKNGSTLSIVYLKPSDDKSRRTIQPRMIGEMEFQGKSFLGLSAFCLKRSEERHFRVDRILEMKEIV